jgi:transposase-like protein
MSHSPTTPVQRARLVAQWRARGGSQARFARQHHVHPRTFWDWVRQHPPATAPREGVAAVEDRSPRFVAVQVEPAAASGDARLVIAWPSGLRLEVPAGTCPTWISAVVASLRPSC